MDADIDEESLRLSIYLQSQDAAALIKGKHRQGEQRPDGELAAELHALELESLRTFNSDRALCRRLNGLGLEDGDLLIGHAGEEQQAAHEQEDTPDDEDSPTNSSLYDNSAASVVDGEEIKSLATS